MGWLRSYLPVMGMLLNQFINAGVSLSTRLVFSAGMSPRVFVVYRHVLATIQKFSLLLLKHEEFLMDILCLLRRGLYLTNSSVASAIVNLVPAVTFVIAACAGMEKVNIGSWRSIAKMVGTVICVSGAVSIALLKGPKLLNAENLPSKAITMASSEADNWFLGCLFLTACCCSWSIWLILMVPASKSHPDALSFSAWMCFMATLQSALVALVLEQDPLAWKINSLFEFGSAIYAYHSLSKHGASHSQSLSPYWLLYYCMNKYTLEAVIIGLYIVLWGKAEEVVVMNVKTDSESMLNSTEEVKISIASSKTNLEEPLLSPHSPSHN
ncbi:hypothetical protein V8G54_010487 [Vigna mungo]|uniref:WAT1-related protein n=1 Tax=Vigna mungo TaxID=3915 RepID=A0AAQ3NWM9_VIGMU